MSSGKQDSDKEREGYSIHNPGNPDFQRRMASAFGNLEQLNPGGGRTQERDSRGPWQRPPAPDYVVNPNRWTHYSLQEEEDLNDQTNRAAALDFLADLRRRHNDAQPLNIFEDSDSKEEEEDEEEDEEDQKDEEDGEKKKEEEKKGEKKDATKQCPPKSSSRPWDPEGRVGRHNLPPPPPMMLINPPLSVHSSLSKRPMQSVPLPKTSGSAALPKAEVRPSVGNTAPDTTYFRPTFQPRWNRAGDHQGGKTDVGTAGAPPPDNGNKPDSASRWMSGTYTMPEYRVGQKRKASRPTRQASDVGQKEQPAAMGLQHLQWYDDEDDEDDDAVPTGVSWEASSERPSEDTSSHTAKKAKKNIRPRHDD
uniref:U5 small nuclear ribonucleoprotein TSSC4 n=1 Tax=Branchiostoma floridae TaxID=7739 RepID=C3ZE64_BRAFL|eukprot:XP_002593009.1 hypothetical protein BRAFLDRAFT_65593 [Branchiostoma floridae]